MAESESGTIDYISLKRPYLIDPIKTGQYNGAHISLPETGVLCGIRPLWKGPDKYHLDKVNIDEFDVCNDCKIGLANHNQDRFRELFPGENIDRYLDEEPEDEKPDPKYTKRQYTSHRSGWTGTRKIQSVKLVPSNISNELKSHLATAGDIEGFEYAVNQCENGQGKRTFEFVGSWGEWAVFEYRRFCKDGSVFLGIVVPILKQTIDAEYHDELRELHTDKRWQDAITIK